VRQQTFEHGQHLYTILGGQTEGVAVVLLSAADAEPRAEPRLRWRLFWSDVEKAKDGTYADVTLIYRIHLHRTGARAEEGGRSWI
jgi:hypothetical protein